MNRPLRDQVLALLDKWATENKKLSLVYTPPGCRIHQSGTVIRMPDSFWFRSHADSVRIILRPEDWASAEILENRPKTTIFVEQIAGQGEFSLGEDLFVERATVNDVTQAAEQFGRWLQLGTQLTVMFHHDFFITAGPVRCEQASQTKVRLIDEKSSKLHILSLGDCRSISLDREQEYCTITLMGERS